MNPVASRLGIRPLVQGRFPVRTCSIKRASQYCSDLSAAASSAAVGSRITHTRGSITPQGLRAASVSKAAKAGASASSGGGYRSQPGGFFFGVHSAFTFASRQRGPQQGHRFLVPIDHSLEAPMDQLNLPLLQRIDGPSAAPAQYVRMCTSFREAVRLAWKLRRIEYMNQRDLAARAGLRRQHIGDYLATDDKPSRRSLPADKVADFEAVVGNTLVSQWLAQRATLTVMEQLQATAKAAA